MNLGSHRSLLLVISTSLPLVVADLAPAQVPANCAVFGTFSGPVSVGLSGLFLAPLDGSPVVPVTGLPTALQQPGGISGQQGVHSIALRPSDGAIVVGTVSSASGPLGGQVELHVLQLVGSAVAPAPIRVLLGTATTNGNAFVFVLPDERILVLASDQAAPLTGGVMAGGVAAILDVSTSPPTVTPRPLSPTGVGVFGGAAMAASGQFLYYLLTTSPGSASAVASLYRWDLASNQACVVAWWAGKLARGVVCDDDGAVYASMNDVVSLQHSIAAVYPNGCTMVPSTTTPSSSLWPSGGLELDRGTGRFLVAAPGWFPGYPNTHFNSLGLVDAVGNATILASPPVGGWGMLAGVVVNNELDSYGAPSDGQNHYWFANFPNAGGAPLVGNLGFSLTMRSSPGPALLSLLGLSLGRGSVSAFGIEWLLDLPTMLLLSVPTASPSTYLLGIPNNPGLIGFLLTAQTLHIESTGQFASSRGLQITIR